MRWFNIYYTRRLILVKIIRCVKKNCKLKEWKVLKADETGISPKDSSRSKWIFERKEFYGSLCSETHCKFFIWVPTNVYLTLSWQPLCILGCRHTPPHSPTSWTGSPAWRSHAAPPAARRSPAAGRSAGHGSRSRARTPARPRPRGCGRQRRRRWRRCTVPSRPGLASAFPTPGSTGAHTATLK